MESIFSPEGNRHLIERIDKLTPITFSQWGKMNVSQMLEHCQQPIKVAFGDLNIKPGILLKLFGPMVKKSLMGPKPLRKDTPTLKEFKVSRSPDFESAKNELKAMVQRFASEGHACIKSDTHPIFGKMSLKEWDELQWKHLDHHLRQFGV